MRRWIAILAVLALTLVPRPASAPPPLPEFPASLRPLSGTAPLNTKLWAFGANAPPLAQVAITFTVDGAPSATSPAALGCCAVAATIALPRSGTATVVVTSPLAELSATFLVGSTDDATPPTLMPPVLLEDVAGRLIIGVNGSDDVALAGFLARVDGEVQGSAPPGYLLDTRRGDDGCVSITAVDLAGNESPPRSICGVRPDGGVIVDAGQADGGGDGSQEGCDCRSTPGRPSILWLAAIWAIARRRR